MATTITTLILAALAGIAFFFAYRERRLYLATCSSVDINRSILRDCSALLDDQDSSDNLKSFVSHVAMMSMTVKLQQELGANPDFLEPTPEEVAELKRLGKQGLYDSLTSAERDKVRTITWKYALATMAFNPKYASTVRLLVETDTYDLMIERMQNPKQSHSPSSTRRAQDVAKVTTRLPQIERMVADQLCPA